MLPPHIVSPYTLLVAKSKGPDGKSPSLLVANPGIGGLNVCRTVKCDPSVSTENRTPFLPPTPPGNTPGTVPYRVLLTSTRLAALPTTDKSPWAPSGPAVNACRIRKLEPFVFIENTTPLL